VTILAGSVTVTGFSSFSAMFSLFSADVSTGITVQQSAQVAFMAVVTVTSSIIAPTTMVFTVYTSNTIVVAGTTAWAVPAGKNLRINNAWIIAASSAVATVGILKLLAATATATPALSVTSTAGVVVQFPYQLTLTSYFQMVALAQDITAGISIAIGVDLAATRHVIQQIVIAGYFF
jgi:hypothetical protein